MRIPMQRWGKRTTISPVLPTSGWREGAGMLRDALENTISPVQPTSGRREGVGMLCDDLNFESTGPDDLWHIIVSLNAQFTLVGKYSHV